MQLCCICNEDELKGELNKVIAPYIKKEVIKLLTLILGMSSLNSFSYAQVSYAFSGSVFDENNHPLCGAFVGLNGVNKSTITDSYGNFTLGDLSDALYEIEISFLGYETLIDTISLPGKTQSFSLKKTSVTLNEIVIADNSLERRKRETSLNIEVVNDDYLKQNLGGSLMKSLERLPGVTTIDIGSGQSKPVLRGLGFNRVVVIENSIKHEAQQWGADHGLEIDQYGVDHIEIIKGPSSLMYGADAIGGIIDIKSKALPAVNSFGGTIDLSGKTNNDFLGTSVSLFARKRQLFGTVRVTILSYGDYKVPTDSVAIYSYHVPLHNNLLRNTAGKEQNLHASFGIIQDQFQSKFYISNVHSKGGFFANAHGLEPRNVDHDVHDSSNRDILFPYHSVNHFKAINRTSYWSNNWRLETDLGYQRNLREEWSVYTQHGYMPPVFPETLDFTPEMERQFEKDIYSTNTKLFLTLGDKTELITGISANHQENKIGGRGFIIPAFTQQSFGSYAVGKHYFSDKSLIQGGLRYDYGTISINGHNDWFASPIEVNGEVTRDYLQRAIDLERSFSNFTWSLGYNYNANKWSLKLNAGKSFRMPIAKELGANGINYHRYSYEVGSTDLSPEVSYQFDMGVEYSTRNFAIGTSPFVNYFSNYIYLNPTSKYDRLYGFGNQVFEYTASEVLRLGGEIHAHFEVTSYLRLGFVGEYVYAEQLSGEKKGFTLPFAPPASAIFNIRYQKPQTGFISNSYISFDYRLTAAQNSIVPPEEPTSGFQVFNLGIGGETQLNEKEIEVSVQVQNILNTRYFNHTSYYRLINVPEAGRNFILNISFPFSMKMKAK